MNHEINRREFVGVTAAAALAGSLASTAAAAEGESKPIKIIGIACSPRKGMTTAKAVQAALDAAKGLDARIQVELIDLGGLNIAGWSPTPPADDFVPLLPKLQDPAVAGLVIGSPSYFRGLSALCKRSSSGAVRCVNLRCARRQTSGRHRHRWLSQWRTGTRH
jgi:hypothetical protein